MLLRLLEEGYQLDEVVFFDTGMEFSAVYLMRDKMLPILEEKGIIYTELKFEDVELAEGHDFEWMMFEKPVHLRNGDFRGYG